MNYVWIPPAADLRRIEDLLELGFGDYEIADDMGVDPIDIQRIRTEREIYGRSN